jgi:hypothetical protein
MGLLDELDDLQLLCGRISHSPSSPSPVTLNGMVRPVLPPQSEAPINGGMT